MPTHMPHTHAHTHMPTHAHTQVSFMCPQANLVFVTFICGDSHVTEVHKVPLFSVCGVSTWSPVRNLMSSSPSAMKHCQVPDYPTYCNVSTHPVSHITTVFRNVCPNWQLCLICFLTFSDVILILLQYLICEYYMHLGVNMRIHVHIPYSIIVEQQGTEMSFVYGFRHYKSYGRNIIIMLHIHVHTVYNY